MSAVDIRRVECELKGSDPNGTTLSAFAMTNVTVIASEARQSTMDRHGLRPRDDETGYERHRPARLR